MIIIKMKLSIGKGCCPTPRRRFVGISKIEGSSTSRIKVGRTRRKAVARYTIVIAFI